MEQNTWPGGGESPGSSASNRLWAFAFRSAIQISRVASRRGSRDPGRGENTGRGFESSGLQASNRRWLVPFIKRKNFRFSESFVFNDIGNS